MCSLVWHLPLLTQEWFCVAQIALRVYTSSMLHPLLFVAIGKADRHNKYTQIWIMKYKLRWDSRINNQQNNSYQNHTSMSWSSCTVGATSSAWAVHKNIKEQTLYWKHWLFVCHNPKHLVNCIKTQESVKYEEVQFYLSSIWARWQERCCGAS